MLTAEYTSVPEIKPNNTFLKVIGILIPVAILGFHLHKKYNFFGIKRNDNDSKIRK